ncbi:MAG: MFS transporter [Anaerolineaceae bacterium]|jgi:GPH family glycoside/pentoside/hexuronide:cation symporter
MTETQLPIAMQPRQLSSGTRIAFGLAQLGMAVISGIYAAMLTKFYQDNLGLEFKWIGIATVIYAIWNAINDPIFGEITDRTKSKLGRRIPYLRYTAPFYALTFIAVWFCPEEASQLNKFIWMLVSMLLYDTCFTIIGLVHGTLMPELSESDKERAKLSVVSTLFGLLGTLLGFIIPELVRPSSTSGATSLLPFRMAMTAVGLIFSAFIYYSSFKLKERREFSEVDEALPWWQAIKSTLTNKGFIVYVITSFMCTFMFSIAMGAIFYLSDYVTKGSVFPLLGALFVPLTIAVPFVQNVLRKLSAAKTWQIFLVISGVGFSLLYFLPANLLTVGLVIAGIGYSGVQVVNYLVLGQVIDLDEIQTGVRREGSYLGANALITKPAQSLAISMTSYILTRTAFVTAESNAGQIFLNQPESALMGIRAIVGLIPGIALIVGAIALFWFPIKDRDVPLIKQKILEMHAQKHERLLSQTDTSRFPQE